VYGCSGTEVLPNIDIDASVEAEGEKGDDGDEIDAYGDFQQRVIETLTPGQSNQPRRYYTG
jgi:hypothetical protein